MSSNKTKTKKKSKANEIDVRFQDYALGMYILIMFGIYPIVFHDKYFDITITRWRTFMIASLIYIFLAVAAFGIDYALDKYYKRPTLVEQEDTESFYARPDFWVSFFLLANIFSLFQADNVSHALSGENGRRLGLWTIITFCVLFMLISMRAKLYMWYYVVLAIVTIYAHWFGLSQHMGVDVKGYRTGIKKSHLFMSTFGNINVYASFICMSLPIFVCIFIFAEKLFYKALAAFVIVISSMAIMACNSDSAYLGLICTMLLIWFFAFKNDRLLPYFFTVVLLALGNFIMVFIHDYMLDTYKMCGGIAMKMDNMKLAVILFIAALVLFGIACAVEARLGKRIAALNKKKSILIMLAAMAVMAVIIFVLGVRSGSDLFVFDDYWGNYRGFIWRISGEIFENAPLTNKIFGYGNESVRALTTSGYYYEMVNLTGTVYDNCHNVILQYLLTTGILGAAAYLGMFISSMVFMLKKAEGDVIVYLSAAACLGYFVQALIAVNQPITTPFFVVFMATGVGYVRYRDMERCK